MDTLKALEVDSGGGCVAPSVDTARDGSYTPLSRPLFIYVKNESLAKPEVYGFVEYFLNNAIQLAEDALFIPIPEDQVATNLSTLEASER
jgi:phosphate transport system substrate-binding protein